MAIAEPAPAAGLPVCTDAQLSGYVAKEDEVAAHRRFGAPTITYPFDALDTNDSWGFRAIVKIDESGNALCYKLEHRWPEHDVPLNDQRRAFIESIPQWRYTPFIKNGKPVVAIVAEEVYEQEAPQTHVPLPNVPPDKVHIQLERTGCFGECPSYSVDVYGDGRVIYHGHEYVDVVGEYTYRIPQQRVAALVESLRAKDIWSLRESYRAGITDNPTYALTFDFGDQHHLLEDYVGQFVGMPRVVSEFEREVDEVSGATAWVNLGKDAVEQLRAAHFSFRSHAGGDLLSRAVSNKDSHDDAAMLRLVELGAPIKPGVIKAALFHRRAVLIDALIERGALETNGAPDQRKIDEAFRAAIAGGQLALIQKIWSVGGTTQHPSLMFDDVSDDDRTVTKRSPVTLALKRWHGQEAPWDGLAIVKWLTAQGCDIKAAGADGDTLLHIATRAGDLELVRYLLSQGLDPSARGHYGPALGGAYDEDVALTLLEAGTDLSLIDDKGYSFRNFAQNNHWGRVIAWLDAH